MFLRWRLIIRSTDHNSPGSEPEQVRKYQIWRWQTASLALDILGAGTVAHAEQHRVHLERHFATAISEVITPFMRSSPDGHGDALAGIVHQAIEFDKQLSTAFPLFTWAFSPRPIESPFDFSLEQEGVMKLHARERASEKLARGTKTKVYLVVTPGMIQRGLEDGEPSSFELDRWISPMEVTCVKPKRQTITLPEDSSETTLLNSSVTS